MCRKKVIFSVLFSSFVSSILAQFVNSETFFTHNQYGCSFVQNNTVQSLDAYKIRRSAVRQPDRLANIAIVGLIHEKEKFKRTSQRFVITVGERNVDNVNIKVHEPVKRHIRHRNIKKLMPKAQQAIAASLLNLTQNSMKKGKNNRDRKKYRKIAQRIDQKIINSLKILDIPHSRKPHHKKKEKEEFVKHQKESLVKAHHKKKKAGRHEKIKRKKRRKKRRKRRRKFLRYFFPLNVFGSPFK